jgi:hypothetical protein
MKSNQPINYSLIKNQGYGKENQNFWNNNSDKFINLFHNLYHQQLNLFNGN